MQKIIVIEDEPQMLRNMLTILELEGYDALGAENGERGLAAIQEHQPGLVFCDIMMPGLDGYAVLRQIRAQPSTSMIPLIFLTARGEKHDMQTGLAMGAEGYLTKPVVLDDLLSVVRKHLHPT
jgi:CheY-like chemotaxis protein